jgi:nitrate reductase NapE component
LIESEDINSSLTQEDTSSEKREKWISHLVIAVGEWKALWHARALPLE